MCFGFRTFFVILLDILRNETDVFDMVFDNSNSTEEKTVQDDHDVIIF